MAISEDELIYLKDAIPKVFLNAMQRAEAFSYLEEDLEFEALILELDEILEASFISAASFIGVNTPKKAMDMANNDISRTQAFIGFDANKPPSPEFVNLAKYTDITHKIATTNTEDIITTNKKVKEHSNHLNEIDQTLGSSSLKKFTPSTVTDSIVGIDKQVETNTADIAALKKQTDINTADIAILKKQIALIFDKLNIHEELTTSSYKMIGNPKTITSCSYDQRTNLYSLEKVVAKGDTTSLGMQKANLDCIDWSNLMENHYFTTTENRDDCSSLIPKHLVYTTCMGALGISIIELL